MDRMITNPEMDPNQQYERFRNNIIRFSNNDNDVISMRDIDLVFFPVVDPMFYYLVVFNLRHPSIMIIDSETQDGTIEEVYEFQTFCLQWMMIMHLKAEGHRAWKAFEEMEQNQLKMRWQLNDNRVDCGVLMMRNMETFMGGDVHAWDSGLYKDSTKQKKQLKVLRTKYLSKILLSKANTLKLFVMTGVQRFISMVTTIAARTRRG